MSIFDDYQPNQKDAAQAGKAPVIPPGTYQARLTKGEKRHAKLPDGSPDLAKIKFYGELVIENGPEKGRTLFIHQWIQNDDLNSKGQPKHNQGRAAFSLLCCECQKQNENVMPKHESELVGFVYSVRISVMENKGTGERTNWTDIIATKPGQTYGARDIGTAPVAAAEGTPF